MLGIKAEPDSELASAAVGLRGLYRERCGLDSAPWEAFDTAGGNLGVILSCARLTDLHLLAGHLSDSGYTQRYIGESMLLTLRVQCSCDQRQVTIDDLIAAIKTCDAILCATQARTCCSAYRIRSSFSDLNRHRKNQRVSLAVQHWT